MLHKCYVKGATVGMKGGSADANPYEAGTEAYDEWLTGHKAGCDAATRMLTAQAKTEEELTDRDSPEIL